ncbi:hypothetical protein J7J63_09665, partial [Candidatus Bipolaricaulota bacterium]|nr:hypothetical protein [Candidatus Bipolaricaulota bacterium]
RPAPPPPRGPRLRPPPGTVREADLILHVVDAARDTRIEDYQAVMSTLDHEVFAGDEARPPIVDVLNKVDLIELEEVDVQAFHRPVFVSAKTGGNINELLSRVRSLLSEGKHSVSLIVPYGLMQDVYELARRERVQVRAYTGEGIEVEATLSSEDLAILLAKGGRISQAPSARGKRP